MSIQKYRMLKADPFVMSNWEVLKAVRNYLIQDGYAVKSNSNENGEELIAENEYHTLVIHALGNHEEQHENFTTYFSNQLVTLLRNYENIPGRTLVMANPDTPIIRQNMDSIKTALDELGVVRFWVKKDLTIEWE
ncbi:hypothetical protein [Bacillus sp. NEB1478]|uniref:hypothetical protein n=1 Tax=Bacillus sp. NEB1478 TaxID=3073816 RepID=UPI002873427B|nr:hypothetical protein [Bacillus sp. NEB1478]WNB90815.1 hypothetical protein RGB74_12925 [Bacillus sp. NEB1478]